MIFSWNYNRLRALRTSIIALSMNLKIKDIMDLRTSLIGNSGAKNSRE